MSNLALVSPPKMTLDSREVARMMEDKTHYDLMKDIRKYQGYLTEGKIPFSDFWQKSSYKDSTGRTLPNYQITPKGCEFLAHKMTGQKGTLFTVAYINRFHEMQAALEGTGKKTAPVPTPLARKTYHGKPVLLVSDLTAMTGINKGTVHGMLSRNRTGYEVLREGNLRRYRSENKTVHNVRHLIVIYQDAAIRLLKQTKNWKEWQQAIMDYYGSALPAPKVPVAIPSKAPAVVPTKVPVPVRVSPNPPLHEHPHYDDTLNRYVTDVCDDPKWQKRILKAKNRLTTLQELLWSLDRYNNGKMHDTLLGAIQEVSNDLWVSLVRMKDTPPKLVSKPGY